MSNKQNKEQSMIFLSGSKRSFRCNATDGKHTCGCNVFTKENSNKSICNACEAVYIAE